MIEHGDRQEHDREDRPSFGRGDLSELSRDSPGRRDPPATSSRAIIEVRDLVKVYGGDTRALDGITFSVAPGEVFGFLGPNGAGKTTTIRVLATLLTATAGSACVAGFDVADDPHEVRKRLGLAMQTPSLDAFSTGRESLELAGRLHRMSRADVRRRAGELLELMGWPRWRGS